MAASPPVNPTSPSARPQPVRHFGRFQLIKLLGKSARTMLWQANDPHSGLPLLLAMPRSRPADAAAAERWRQAARRALRIDHPSLAHGLEVGEHEHWPFTSYELGNASVLSANLSAKGQPAQEMVPWAIQVLQGLAFAHEAGAVHHDLQPYMVLLPDQGPARLLGLGVALEPAHDSLQGLAAQRQHSERDVLAFGVLMHHALAGQPALDQIDVTEVIARLPPVGRELVRLPWSTAHKIPEALRAIVNRATDRQERQRYRNPRTVARALEGWLHAEGEQGAGPLALLLDRIRSAGLLPARPGGAQRAARMALMERERNDELAEVVLQDVALAFELLRSVNSAQVRGATARGNGPVLTIRRTIDMLGLDGVRRAALSLRAWPGPLNAAQAVLLERLIERVQHAGRVAQSIRPAGYDGELVFLLTLLQNLGRLVVCYHFPDEAAQIERLMKPAPPAEPIKVRSRLDSTPRAGGLEGPADGPGAPSPGAAAGGAADDPGMSEEAASFAVLGIDIAAVGSAIGRHWGLDEAVLHMIQRLPLTAPVRSAGSDDELLRMSASCANELIDAMAQASHHRAGALLRVVQRYGRVLGLTLQDIQQAVQGTAPKVSPAHAEPGSARAVA